MLASELGLITLNPSSGQVTIYGTPDHDSAFVRYEGAAEVAVTIETSLGTETELYSRVQVRGIVFFGGDGDDRFTNDTFIASEAHGGYGADQLLGGDGDDRLYGGPGNDLIEGRAGADLLGGGDGDDTLRGGDGPDQLFGEWGHDLLHGDAGDDRLFGYDGNDQLWGGSGNDFLFGDNDQDTIDGGAGDDYVFGGAGDDILQGGDDSDRIFAGVGDDVADGGPGTDYLFGDAGDDLLRGGLGDDQLFGEAGNDTLEGGDGDDRLFAGADDDLLYGGNGHDYLFGEEGHDTLHGEAGHDQLFGQGGDDHILGGTGEDRIFGGFGNDRAEGGPDTDFVFGEAGDDWLDGGDGHDFVYGGVGQDTLLGGVGSDNLYGGDGADFLDAGAGDDALLGGPGDDVMHGGDGHDVLYGEQGNDILRGGAGNDSLIGHEGDDVLIGGDGDDGLLGSEGRDLLIGGRDRDDLLGLAGEDILNGGSTSFDDDDDALRAIMAIWSGGQDFTARVQMLEDPTQPLALRSAVTVHDDGVVDRLAGYEDRDWFFETGWLAGQRYGANDPPPATVYTTLLTLDNLADIGHHDYRQTLIPHAHDPAARREHSAMLSVFDYRDMTHEARQSGNWSDSATWAGGAVPPSGAYVLIPAGVELTVDGQLPSVLHTLRVDGVLRFSTSVDSRLRVNSMLVAPGGRLEMGTAEQPIPGHITARIAIADTGPIDRVRDPFAFGRGLVVHGAAQFHGEQRTSHLPLAVAPSAGTKELQLEQLPTNWRVGDQIVVSGTRHDRLDHEVREILAINGNRLTVAPLEFDHLVPKPELRVHVAHLTRNVVVESESRAADRRGHVMFMHTPLVEVHNTAFEGLGRSDKLRPINDSVVDSLGNLQPGSGTNQRGRYAVHFHRIGTDQGAAPIAVQGNVVRDSLGWGFVNHSSNIDMTDNVAFDVDGSAFVTEAGDEIGSFRRNIAIYSQGSSESDIIGRFGLQDFGHQGDGFWLQGPGVVVEENIASGQAGNGIVFFTFGFIDAAKGTTMFPSANLPDPSIAGGAAAVGVGDVPLFSFRNNTVYDSSQGVQTRYHLLDKTHDQQTLIQDLLLWNNRVGMNVPYTNDTELRDVRIIHGFDRLGDTGLDRNHDTEGILYNNVWIEGYYFGMRVPNQNDSVIQGGYFKNVKNIVVASVSKAPRSVLITGDITFDVIPPSVLNGHIQVRVMTDATYALTDYPGVEAFLADTVTLNFGEFRQARLYFAEQRASHVVFPSSGPHIPPQYVGRTNQQLWDSHGLALGGAIAPDDALLVSGVVGLVDMTP
ncbi:MAG: hypothetical protein J5I93_15050 [Pirellulaceae bacterium]|nr:hypothetical protein [Pirellulaceae bacterium]